MMRLECFHSEGLQVERQNGEVIIAPYPTTVVDLGFEDDTEFSVISGWWARYSAPGYMDSTDWIFSPNSPMEAVEECFKTFGDPDNERDVEEYEEMMKAARNAVEVQAGGYFVRYKRMSGSDVDPGRAHGGGWNRGGGLPN